MEHVTCSSSVGGVYPVVVNGFFCYFARLVLKFILQSLFLTFKMAVDKVSHYISPLCHLTAVKNILNVILLRLKFDDLS